MLTGPFDMTAVAARAADFGSAAESIDRTSTPLRSTAHRKKDVVADWSFGPSGPQTNVTKWLIRGKSANPNAPGFLPLTGELVICSAADAARHGELGCAVQLLG